MYGGGRYGGGHGCGYGGRRGRGGEHIDAPDRDDSSGSDNDPSNYSGSDDQSFDDDMSYGRGRRGGAQGRGIAGRPPPRAPPGMMDRGNRQAEPGSGGHLRYTGSVSELPQELQGPFREKSIIWQDFKSDRIEDIEANRRLADLHKRNGWPAPALFEMSTLCPPDWVRARSERERLLESREDPRGAPGGMHGGHGNRQAEPGSGAHPRYTGSISELPPEMQRYHRETMSIHEEYLSGRIDSDEASRRMSNLPGPHSSQDPRTLYPP